MAPCDRLKGLPRPEQKLMSLTSGFLEGNERSIPISGEQGLRRVSGKVFRA
jgi:hypothetical protein